MGNTGKWIKAVARQAKKFAPLYGDDDDDEQEEHNVAGATDIPGKKKKKKGLIADLKAMIPYRND